jgi:hypothetical protein
MGLRNLVATVDIDDLVEAQRHDVEALLLPEIILADMEIDAEHPVGRGRLFDDVVQVTSDVDVIQPPDRPVILDQAGVEPFAGGSEQLGTLQRRAE